MHRNAEQWSVVEPGRFIVNPATQVASDHYPLLAVLELVPADADYDSDGDVDGGDLLTWQRNLGAAGAGRAGDANHDRLVDAADLAVWRAQFQSAAAPAHSIPEPTTLGLVAAGALVHLVRRRLNDLAAA
jgi:hypothetical protein